MGHRFRDLSVRDRRIVVGCAVGLAIVYAMISIVAAATLRAARLTAEAKHAARIHPTAVEPGLTPPEPVEPAPDAVEIHVGTYVDRIDSVSPHDSSWMLDMYLWFRWRGPHEIDPAGHLQLVDAIVESKELQVDRCADGACYQKLRVYARQIKQFDTTRFPLDDHLLTVFVEHSALDATAVRFVVDEGASDISSRVMLPGYRVVERHEVSKPHTYKSMLGDPERAAGARRTFSQYLLGIEVERLGISLLLKMFAALYAAVAISCAVFFIRPTNVDPRFGLAAGAFFGAVANLYLTNELIPNTASFGLADFVNGLGMFTIFVVVAESVYSLHLCERGHDEPLSRVLDQTAAWVVPTVYVVANVVIPWSAAG